jgi:3-methyladenine DNA glycosylase AlkD
VRVNEVVEQVTMELADAATPERAEKEQTYLKSELAFLGASVPAIRRAARGVSRDHPETSRDDLVALVEELWSRGVHELRMVAVELLEVFVDRLGPDDVPWLESLVRGCRTWALLDGLSASVVGALLDRYPKELAPHLTRWAGDDDFWLRRASLLTHLPGLRRGEGDFERFGALADTMLDDREFFVRKAIGWVLRDTGKRRPELVVAWLEPRAGRVAGLTFREAVKHLPDADRERLAAVRAAG